MTDEQTVSPPAKRAGVCRGHIALAVIVVLLALHTPAIAQEEPATAPQAAATAPQAEATSTQAKTIADPKIAVDHLTVMLRPLMKDELESEARAWLDLLKAKITQIGETELQLKAVETPQESESAVDATAEPQSADELQEMLISLRTEEAALTERARVVLEALKEKGGDVTPHETYIKSATGLAGATDATSFWAALVSWLKRPDGGQVLGKRLLSALVILLVFWIVSKSAGRAIDRALSRRTGVSNLLKNFAKKAAGVTVLVIGAVMALGALGVQIGPLLAAMGAGGFIVAFALQETLGNFASGLMIMIYRPFDVDDYVTVAGVEGKVKEMTLVSTTLLTADNKVLIIPNKTAWGGTITNFTGSDVRRVDLVFGIGYEDDIQKAVDVLEQVAAEHDLVLDDPAPAVKVHELADSSVNLVCRPWVKTADYWTVYWDLMRQVKERFDAEGISIPFPQRDVHVHQQAVSA